AAFLTSLSANLTLPDVDSPFPSPVSTPLSMRDGSEAHISHLPPPSPLASAIPMSADEYSSDAKQSQSAGANPLAGVPELLTAAAQSEEDKVAALKLVADSVAQQRQAASWALLSHPAVIAGYVLLLAVLYRFMYRVPSDMPVLFTTGAGVTMACLVTVRLLTGGYIRHAESINWGFLDEAADSVIITRFGEQIIGALVLGWAGPSSTGNKAARRRKGRGMIKAWTVKLRYRGKGVGTGLLEEAVKETVKRGGEGVEFAEDHANSRRFLPHYFNGFLDRREDRAHDALQDVINTSGAFNGRRRKSSVY
ncbi:hypothetical protein B0J12DRAFT_580550, partial [Macrophomina phaseolina]